jgi:transposase InsO family protein
VARGTLAQDAAARDLQRRIQARQAARRYRGRALHVVLDNSSTHSTPAVQTWLSEHPEVQFHFTPKGASWLNMVVEAWFGILTRKSVRRGSFDTVRALIRHIEAYITEWNSHPTPFVWTKDPAAIVKQAVCRGGR